MNKKIKKDKVGLESSNINEENGLNITYDKQELMDKFPNLISEIDDKQKALKIDAVENKFEQGFTPDNKFKYCEDLSNPGAIDFIRRCKTKEEAITVLDYLLNRKELSKQDHTFLIKKVNEVDGLKKLIEQCGGYKTPGYYMKKYYSDEKVNNLKKTTND
jgi:hypothetical protein